jgi:hypothetical protein
MKTIIFLSSIIYVFQIICPQLGISQSKTIEFTLDNSSFENGQNLLATTEYYNFYLTMKNDKVAKITGYNLQSFKSTNVSFKSSDFIIINHPGSKSKIAKLNNGGISQKGATDKTSRPMCMVCETYPCPEGGSDGKQSVPWCVKNCDLKPCTNRVN